MPNTIKYGDDDKGCLMSANLFGDFCHFSFPQPQYLGSKYKHLHFIRECLPANIKCVADAFAGSQSVAYFFKQSGYEVYTNDFLSFSHKIGQSLVENKHFRLDESDITILLQNNQNPTHFDLMKNLFTDIFFKEEETRFLDSFRSNIESLPKEKQPLAFSIINRSITRKVTMGHFAHTSALSYANNKDRIKRNPNLIRPIKEIFLNLVQPYNSSIFDNLRENKSYNLDAIEFVDLIKDKVDLVYFDPPYCGSHADYQAFYHLLETYTQYWKDKEFINGTKRYSPKKYSGFDTKADILPSFEKLFEAAAQIPHWIISYNDRSFPSIDTMKKLAGQYKNIEIKEKSYQNSVGGKGSVKGSKEILLVCSPKH